MAAILKNLKDMGDNEGIIRVLENDGTTGNLPTFSIAAKAEKCPVSS